MDNRPHLLQVREFKPAQDYEMICRWCESRSRQPRWGRAVSPPVEMLPPYGGICFRTDGFHSEDLAAMWLYACQGTPICFAEHCVTKPGMRLATAKLAILHIEKFLKELAHALGYRVMIAHVLPAMARYMQHIDWYRADGDLIAMWTETKRGDMHLLADEEGAGQLPIMEGLI